MAEYYKCEKKVLRALKNLHKDEEKIVDILHDKLSKGLDKTSGNDIKSLNKNFPQNCGRIKIGKGNKYRLLYCKRRNGNDSTTYLLGLIKTDDPRRKNGYPELKLIAEKFDKDETQFQFTPIKNYNLKTKETFNYFITEGYKYQVNLTAEQEDIISSIDNREKQISFITGTPGSGKSLTGAEIAMRTFLAGKTALVVVPTFQLVEFYKNHLINNNIKKENIITDFNWSNKRLVKNSIIIVQMNKLVKSLLGKSVQESTQKAISEIEKWNVYNQLKKEFSPNEIIDIYNAFWDVNDEQIEEKKKDAVFFSHKEKIQKLNPHIKNLSTLLSDKNIKTRKELAYEFFSRQMPDKDNIFANFLKEGPDYDIVAIVDEVQDLIYEEWKGFIDLSVQYYRKRNGFFRTVFLGDEKQRISVSGFNWAYFSDTIFKATKSAALARKDIALKKNFRVTKQVAEFIEWLDNNVEKNSTKAVPTLKRGDCTNEGSEINILQADLETLRRSIRRLKASNELPDSDKAIVIKNEKDENVEHEAKDYEILSPFEAKGTEHENVFLLNPFKQIIQKINSGKNKEKGFQFDIDDNYRLYTMATRSRNALTILLSKEELIWLKESFSDELQNYSSIKIHDFNSSDSVSIIEELIKKVGLGEISEEDRLQIILNKIEELLKNTKHNKLQTFEKLNNIILDSMNIPHKIRMIVNSIKDFEIKITDALNKSIEIIGDIKKQKYVLIFWLIYNGEYIKASRTARESNNFQLLETIDEIINKDAHPLIKFVNNNSDEKDNSLSALENDFLSFFNKEIETKPENIVLTNYYNGKINALNKVILEAINE